MIKYAKKIIDTSDGKLFNRRLLDDIIKAGYNAISVQGSGTDLFIWFNDLDYNALITADFTAIDTVVAAHVGSDNYFKVRKEYINHKRAGKNYRNYIHDGVILQIRSLTMSEVDAITIEDILDKVFDKIEKGEWKSAQHKMTQVSVISPLTQVFYDEIKTFIDNYIIANYV